MANGDDTVRMVKEVTTKHETVVIFIKGFAFVGIGFLTPLTTALTQYQAQDKMPGPIVWIVVIALCAIGAFSAILSFLSGSYSDYNKKLLAPPAAAIVPHDPLGNSPTTTSTVRQP